MMNKYENLCLNVGKWLLTDEFMNLLKKRKKYSLDYRLCQSENEDCYKNCITFMDCDECNEILNLIPDNYFDD